jgi:hypothetical protein
LKNLLTSLGWLKNKKKSQQLWMPKFNSKLQKTNHKRPEPKQKKKSTSKKSNLTHHSWSVGNYRKTQSLSHRIKSAANQFRSRVQKS